MNQLKIIFSDRVIIPQTILCGSLKCACDTEKFQDAEKIQETGDTTHQKNPMIPRATSIHAYKIGVAIIILTRKTRDSYILLITTSAESFFVLHIFLLSIKRLSVLASKTIIRTCCLFHRVSP